VTGSGLGLLAKSGADIPEAVLAAVPALVAVLVIASWIRDRKPLDAPAVVVEVRPHAGLTVD
jgi:hypothetical protein